MGEEKMLTIKELAEEFRVSDQTIYRAIKAGKLPAYQVGRQYRIKRSDAEKVFLKGGEKG